MRVSDRNVGDGKLHCHDTQEKGASLGDTSNRKLCAGYFLTL